MKKAAQKIKDGLFYPNNVCKVKCRSRVENYTYLEIDMRNPVLTSLPDFRLALIFRRRCHLLFDRMRCQDFEEIHAKATQAYFHLYTDALKK